MFTDEDLPPFIFEINDTMLSSWCPYGREYADRMDCGVNSIKFIGILEDEIGFNLAKLRNETKKGMTYAEIIYFIQKKYRNYNFYFKNIKNIHDFFKNLPRSIGVIAVFNRINDIGHAVIIAKDKNKNLLVLDTQSQRMINISELSDYNQYKKDNNYDSLHILVMEEISTEPKMFVEKKARLFSEINSKKSKISPPKKKANIQISPATLSYRQRKTNKKRNKTQRKK